jgi:hypothetical protein
MEPNEKLQNAPNELSDDILEGADAIAEFIFGDRTSRRKVYYLAQRTKLPIFRFGAILRARKSVLLKFITGQENKALPPEG